MTQEIKLPPLPEWADYTLEGDDRAILYRWVEAAIEPYKQRIEELEAQLEAIGAGGVTEGQRLIESDRQRRGEPVAWIQRSYLNLIRESNVALHNVVIRGSKLDGDGDVVPLYAAPQPAKPCASSVSDKTTCGSASGDCDSQRAEPVNVSEARKYAKQELLSATDKAYRLITNSEAPQRFEGIFGRDAEPVVVYMYQDKQDYVVHGTVPKGTSLRPGINTLYTAPVAAQPSVPEPLKYGREWKDHYVTGWNNCRAAMLAAEQAQQECGCCGRSDGCDPDCDASQPAANDNPTPEEEEAWQQIEKKK